MSEQVRPRTNDVSAEEFRAQFSEPPREILVRIQWSWERGSSEFPRLGDLYIARANYTLPFDDYEGIFEPGGQVFWLCRKKLFGYRYEHYFARNKFYRLRVRFFPDTKFCLLDGIVAENVEPEKDDAIYGRVYEKFMSRFSGDTAELTVYPEEEVGNLRGKFMHLIRTRQYPFITYADETGSVRTGNCMLHVPVDNRNFKAMKALTLKPGTLYRLRVRCPAEGSGGYLLESVLESNVHNAELEAAAKAALETVKITVGELGELTRVRQGGMLYFEGTLSRNGEELFTVTLAADDDAPASANGAMSLLNDIIENMEQWQGKIFGAVADDVSDDEGRICTWEYESDEDEFSHALTREEFIRRLSLDTIDIDSDGTAEIYVGLDDMFTDHCYSVGINADRSIEVGGLMG